MLHNTVTPVLGAAIEMGAPGISQANATIGETPGGLGDTACDADCFVDLDSRVLVPRVGGPLIDGGVSEDEDVDFCGNERVGSPDIGALEADHRMPGSLEPLFKTDLCDTFIWETGDTGASTDAPIRPSLMDTGNTQRPRELTLKPRHCGCTAAPALGPSGLLALTLIALGRRRG